MLWRYSCKIVKAIHVVRPDVSARKSSQRSGIHSVVRGGHMPFWPNSGAGGSRPVSWLRRDTLLRVVQGLRGNQYARVRAARQAVDRLTSSTVPP
jgi:hypothetical protein